MTALKAPTRRVVTALALAAGAALTMSACSAGQITQTSTQVPAINGSNVDAGSIALRNVHFPRLSRQDHVQRRLEGGLRGDVVRLTIGQGQHSGQAAARDIGSAPAPNSRSRRSPP